MIRPLTPGDAAEAATLIRTAFAAQPIPTDPPSGALQETTETVAARITAGGGACVARDRMMAAVVLWQCQDGGLYFGRLAVHPRYRRQGLARALVGAAEDEARRRNLPRLHLETRLSLHDNRAMFAACGFTEGKASAHPGYSAPTSVHMEKWLLP